MIKWFANNGVAANLLMMIILVGGIGSLIITKRELFPSFSLDTIVVRVPYRGAAPEEVEKGVILRIEEALQGVDGIKELRSSAREGYGEVSIEVNKGADVRKVKDDVESRVDAITTFPIETERPIIEELLIDRDVLWVAVYGNTSEKSLKEIAEKVREEIIAIPGISQGILQGIRDYEISIELREVDLIKYGLTFDEVAQAVQRNSIDIPSGSIKADGGEILLRTKEQAYIGRDFESLVIITNPNGTHVTLGDIATIRDDFVDDALISTFNGKPAAMILFREVGRENPLHISEKINEYVKKANTSWIPEGIELTSWADASFYLEGRLNMLIKNGLVGFLLVFFSLSLFLRPSLAFFVAIGIPISFLGTFLVGPFLGLSINLISLFAFILVLGIVVDDAIVVGESVFSQFQKNGSGVNSAIKGTKLVSTPVTYAILTTAVAFIPVFMLPGQLGKFFTHIPLVVIPTLLFSLVQSKLVLPYHLSLCNVGDKKNRSQLGTLSKIQRKIADGLERVIDKYYRPALDKLLEFRYATLATFIALLIFTVSFIAGGWIKFSPFPQVPSDFIQIDLKLPEGTPVAQTESALNRISNALEEIREEDISAKKGDPIKHVAEFIGFGRGSSSTNRAFFLVEMTKSEIRDSSANDVADRWRKKIGTIPGARQLIINSSAGPPTGLPIDIRLTGPNFDQLQVASKEIQRRLAEFDGLYDIRDTYSEGKREILLKLKPQAEVLGLSASDLGRQVRSAFFGADAQRIQRGKNDIRVMIRYPPEDRSSLADLENMRIRTPQGHEVPITELVELSLGEGFPTITRIDKKRVINIQADANKAVADFAAINKALYGKDPDSKSILKDIENEFPGVSLVKGGEAKDWEETKASLFSGVILVAFLIYALLAVPFKSYIQPFIVMGVIPFGVCGAVIGHLITGQSLSILSFLGIIALAGVVVNDSLVLVDYINRHRDEGDDIHDAIRNAGAARFRPIILTSITTFVGLVPILLERSLQAQFLIPMATSLGFGILFATFITLILVPVSYFILEDFTRLLKKMLSAVF